MGKKYDSWDLDNEDRLALIVNQVRKLPIEDVLEHHGVVIEKRAGRNYLALCPFHMDNHIGSFSINTETNSCKCFACGNGGGVIGAMQKILKLDFKDTVLKVAADEGLIDEAEYETLSGVKYDASNLKPVTSKRPKEKKRPSNKTYALWTIIYEYMRDYFGLTPEHKAVLENERYLPGERIKEDYFSIDTTDKAAVSRFIYRIRQDLPEYAETLKDVPGFFEYNTKKGWMLQVLQFKGIAILIRNARGQVVAVQIRSDEVGIHEQRYRYLSFEVKSKYKAFKDYRGGASGGTPIDVITSKNVSDKLAIVEGRFKSEILTQQGLSALSVQGVNNFKGIDQDINDLEKKYGIEYKKVYLFYDADFMKNGQVYQAGISLKKYLAEKRPDIELIIAVWDDVFGKGIDDMIIAGYRDECKFIKSDYYEDVFNESYNKAVEICNIDVNDLVHVTKEERTKFINTFGELVKRKLL